MDFDFSPEQQQLRDQVRRMLAATCPSAEVRAVMEGQAPFAAAVWRGMADMGLLGITIAEAHGGLGLSPLELCVVAEELGRVVAPVPFFPSATLAADLLALGGSAAQQARWLPGLAAGETVVAVAPAPAAGGARAVRADAAGLQGWCMPVADGAVAGAVVVLAESSAGPTLYLVDMASAGVDRGPVDTLDPSRPHARIAFANVAAEVLGAPGEGAALLAAAADRSAIYLAFQQLGGAERALEMARDYAQERIAFGRPIGSFQALKHMMADMYVAVTLARSNCYRAAWALACSPADLPQDAATARISATEAYQLCARQAIQVHGGIGFTWEHDCHLHYRRSQLLALSLGGIGPWADRLIEAMENQSLAEENRP